MTVNPIKVTISITVTGGVHIYLHSSSRAQGVSCIFWHQLPHCLFLQVGKYLLSTAGISGGKAGFSMSPWSSLYRPPGLQGGSEENLTELGFCSISRDKLWFISAGLDISNTSAHTPLNASTLSNHCEQQMAPTFTGILTENVVGLFPSPVNAVALFYGLGMGHSPNRQRVLLLDFWKCSLL